MDEILINDPLTKRLRKIMVYNLNVEYRKRGVIFISFTELVKKLGEPKKLLDNKRDAEWEIEFKEGTILRIYNNKVKDGDDLSFKDVHVWCVEGFSRGAFYIIETLFPEKRCLTNRQMAERDEKLSYI